MNDPFDLEACGNQESAILVLSAFAPAARAGTDRAILICESAHPLENMDTLDWIAARVWQA